MVKKIGRNKSPSIIPNNPPITVSIIALYACPFMKYLWPGSTFMKLSSCGAPKQMLGIKSTKECTMPIAIIHAAILMSAFGRYVASIIESRFMWMPGSMPLIMPRKQPAKIYASISNNLQSLYNYFNLSFIL